MTKAEFWKALAERHPHALRDVLGETPLEEVFPVEVQCESGIDWHECPLCSVVEEDLCENQLLKHDEGCPRAFNILDKSGLPHSGETAAMFADAGEEAE